MLLLCSSYITHAQSRGPYIGATTVNTSSLHVTEAAGSSISSASTQNPATVAQWNYSGGNTDINGVDWSYSIIATDKKEYIGCGYSRTDPSNPYDEDPIIYKLDHLGNLVWAKALPYVGTSTNKGGKLYQVIKATDGYVAVGINNDAAFIEHTCVIEFDDDGVFKNGTPALLDPLDKNSSYSQGYSVALDPNYNSINHILVAAVATQYGHTTPDGAVVSTLDLSGSSLLVTSSHYSGFTGVTTKILTQSVSGASYFNIFVCGTQVDAPDGPDTANNWSGTSRTYSPPHSDIWIEKYPSDFSSGTITKVWTKADLGTITNTEVGRVTARNTDAGTGYIKYVNPETPGVYRLSPITEYLNAAHNNNCSAQDMIITNDGNIAMTATVNNIALATGDFLIDNVNDVIGPNTANPLDPPYDEYIDMDGFLININTSDLTMAYNKSVGHFSGSDFKIKLVEDKSSRFIISGSTADAYGSTDPNLPDNVDTFAENAYIVCTHDDATSSDIWKRSFAAFPNEDCACIFGIALTADDGYVICGNNDNNYDDFTVTKFAPLAEENYVKTAAYETFGGSSAPDIYTLTSSETWSSPKTIASEIVVPNGVTLTISNTTIQFASSDELWDYFLFNNSAGDNTTYTVSDHIVSPLSNGRMVGIVVQPGGHLIVSSAALESINFPTVGDRNMWDGIVVQGTPTDMTLHPTAPQGTVTITGTTSSPSVIQDARFGIYVADNWRSYMQPIIGSYSSTTTGTSSDHYSSNLFSSRYDGNYNLGGGIVTASNCNFLNCNYGATFENMIYPGAGGITNTFTNCAFSSDATGLGDICFYTDANGNNIPSNTFISEWQEVNVTFQGNTYTCDPSFPQTERPIGIEATASGMMVDYGPGPTRNIFSNLSQGIQMNEGCPTLYAFDYVSHATFDNNITGINASGKVNNVSIVNNQFNVPAYSSSAPSIEPMGINLFVCRGYDVSFNTFDYTSASGGALGNIGITVNDGCEQNETINNNYFEHISVGNEALQWNGDTTGNTGLQYRCNTFDYSLLPIAVNSSRWGTLVRYPGVIRPNQGSCGTSLSTPAGNQFNLPCSSIYQNLYADGLVSEAVFYNNNDDYSGSEYDPGSCINSRVFSNVPCSHAPSIPALSSACPVPYDYTNASHRDALTDLATLDGTISGTTDAGALADLWAQHDAITGYLARYYGQNAMYDSAAAMFAGYGKSRDALPFYLSAGEYSQATNMWTALPMVTDEDKLYSWEAAKAISLFSAGHTWLDADTVTLDSMTRIVQYNSAAGGMAGGTTALLGMAPVTYPSPALDPEVQSTLLSMDTHSGGRTANTKGNATAVNNIQSQKAGEFTVYPNPTYGSLSIATSAAGTFILYTMLGQEIQKYDLAAGKGDMQLPAGLAAGIYIGKFTSTDGGIVKEVRLVYQP